MLIKQGKTQFIYILSYQKDRGYRKGIKIPRREVISIEEAVLLWKLPLIHTSYFTETNSHNTYYLI